MSVVCSSFKMREDEDMVVYHATNQINEKFSIFVNDNVSVKGITEGMYLFFIYLKKCSEFFVIQDKTTSFLNVYYTIVDDIFYCSTSLKILLKESGGERKLNVQAVNRFINNGFLFGAETFIGDIFKIRLGHNLKVAGGIVDGYKIDKSSFFPLFAQ